MSRLSFPEPDEIPLMTGHDHASFEAWLDYHRQSLLFLLDGLTPDEACRRPIPPSTLSLIGLVRHMREVEHYWFHHVLAGRQPKPIWWAGDEDDVEFNGVSPATVRSDIQEFMHELDRSRTAANGAQLDAPAATQRHGNDVNLHWIYVHMVEEYARHLGHGDMIRQVIDGRTAS